MNVPCPQCGAEIQVREAAGFPVCPYCRVSFVLDLSGARPHHLYRPRILSSEVLLTLRRWTDGQRLPSPIPLSPPRLTFYPFWCYRNAGPSRCAPAWPTLGAHWDSLAAPDAEQIFFDPKQTGEGSVVEATVPEASARRWLGLPDDAGPGSLAHLPFFEIDATLGGRQTTLVVDACAGRVYAEDGYGAGAAPRRVDRGLVLAACALALAGLLLPTVAALPAVAGIAGWLWARLAAEGRLR